VRSSSWRASAAAAMVVVVAGCGGGGGGYASSVDKLCVDASRKTIALAKKPPSGLTTLGDFQRKGDELVGILGHFIVQVRVLQAPPKLRAAAQRLVAAYRSELIDLTAANRAAKAGDVAAFRTALARVRAKGAAVTAAAKALSPKACG
jgi:hypothetical protein